VTLVTVQVAWAGLGIGGEEIRSGHQTGKVKSVRGNLSTIDQIAEEGRRPRPRGRRTDLMVDRSELGRCRTYIRISYTVDGGRKWLSSYTFHLVLPRIAPS
jgi:hypothetical protein